MSLRPSLARALGLRLLDATAVLVTFMLAVALLCGGGGYLFQSCSGKPALVQNGESAGLAEQDLRTQSEKMEGALGTGIEGSVDIARAVVQGLRSRPDIRVPDTPFACLVEVLLGRSASCPPSLNSLDKCLSRLSKRELNRPIGLIRWVQDSSEPTGWRMVTGAYAGENGPRSDDGGMTYTALYFEGEPAPSNALKGEHTVLTIAPVADIPALIRAGADPGLYFGVHGDTALTFSARTGDIERAMALIRYSSETAMRTQAGTPASMIYTRGGPNDELFKELLE